MPSGRGLIRGFIAGVTVTLVVAVGVGYVVYKKVETAISSESVKETAEETLARIMGGKVQIQSGEISLPNLLTLSDVSFANAQGKIVSFDRVELIAEGGVQGIREGQFAQVILTHPVITLERVGETWNLVEFLKPLIAGAQVSHESSPSEASGEQKPLPVKMIQMTGLDFQVSLKDKEVYSGISAKEVTLSRENLDSPWVLYCKQGRLRLNPSADEWPLVETYVALADLVAPQPAGEIGSSTGPSSPSLGVPFALGDILFDDFDLEFIHPKQHLTLSGLSLRSDEFFELIRIQTGNLEKKTPHPKA